MYQMTTAIAIEDVRREVKILKALSGHKNTIKFYDAFEDAQNVYIVMEYVLSFFKFIDGCQYCMRFTIQLSTSYDLCKPLHCICSRIETVVSNVFKCNA